MTPSPTKRPGWYHYRKVQGTCLACGEPAIANVRFRGKKVRACNRCSSRVRQGGHFLGPWRKRRERYERRYALAQRLHAGGRSLRSISKRLGVSYSLVCKWFSGTRGTMP